MFLNGIRIADAALLHVLADLAPGTPIVLVSENAPWSPVPALSCSDPLETLTTVIAGTARISGSAPILGWLQEPVTDETYERAFVVQGIAADSVNGPVRTVLLSAAELNKALSSDALVIQVPSTGSPWVFALIAG